MTPTPTTVAPERPRAVLDELDDLEGRERSTRRKVRDLVRPAEEKARVRVSRQHRGRRTGWGVTCSGCGVLPVLIPRRSGAKAVALDHARTDHPEGATVRVEGG